jgi:hypothetical protein
MRIPPDVCRTRTPERTDHRLPIGSQRSVVAVINSPIRRGGNAAVRAHWGPDTRRTLTSAFWSEWNSSATHSARERRGEQ